MLDAIQKFSDYIEPEIVALLKEEGDIIPNLTDGVFYSIKTGGKRLRPFLCYEACKKLGGDLKIVLPFAVAMEIMHNWIIIHDDIEDGDTIRRNKETVWSKFGLPHGINIGDYLQNVVYQILLRTRDQGIEEKKLFVILELVSQTLIYTTQGQALDINLSKDNCPTEEKYMKCVMLKAGYYLSCPIIVGAIVANANNELINKIRNFGKYIGPAFQIRDDLIDLTKGKGRNNVIGNDIREGKRTLLVVDTFLKCSQLEKNQLLKILNKKRKRTESEDVKWVINLFDKYNSIEYADKYSKHLIEKANKEIRDIPNDIKNFLTEVSEFMVERTS